MKNFKIFIYLIILFFPTTSYSLIEVDITRGNLNPLPIAVSPLFSDKESQLNLKKNLDIENLGLEIADVVKDNLKRTGLFNPLDKDAFLEEKLAVESIRKKPTKGETLIPLTKVHEGEMAIVVYHDENGDGELNTGLFWRPKEGFAFSNNYIPKGPPKFEKATVNMIHGEIINITLNY